MTEAPPDPSANQAERIDGLYTLRIPRIGVDAPVVPIQSNEDRVLNPPRDPSVVGWWSDGAAPGETRGSAVLVGHTVRNNGGGVFDNVGDLGRGDAIQVKRSGSTFGYRVKSIDVLSKERSLATPKRSLPRPVPAGWSSSPATIGTAARGGPTS